MNTVHSQNDCRQNNRPSRHSAWGANSLGPRAMSRLLCRLLLAGALIGAALTAPAQAPPAIPTDWEADVAPPPPGEWVRNMPGQRVPRDMPSYVLRAFYLIPSNRTAMQDAVPRMQDWILTMQAFYREQMERYGFGPKTFSFETELDGITPLIHVVNAPETDDYYRANPWTRVSAAAQNAGLSVWAPRQVWLGVFEGHVLNADGSLEGVFNGGSNSGSGDAGGFALLDSNALACGTRELMANTLPYDGQVLSDLGNFALKYEVTGAWFEGASFGELASTWFGAAVHETGHAFGLEHDYRNDLNARGNLMGNGFRGFRQWMFPALDYASETRLCYSSALVLNQSRYFKAPATYADNIKPDIGGESASNVELVGGQLPISFTAYDAGGLSFAQLTIDDEVVAQMTLSGTNVSETFYTPYFNTGLNSAIIAVWDQAGNKQIHGVNITTVLAPGNRAPEPLLYVEGRSIRTVGESMKFNAESTDDADSFGYQLGVKFDLDGDNVFETENSFTKYRVTGSYGVPGVYMARVQVTDGEGGTAVSEPIAVKITAEPAAVRDWTLY